MTTLDSLPDLLTIAQVCEYLGVSKPTLYDLLRDGLPALKFGRRVRIRKADLIAFLEAHPWTTSERDK